jgi:2-amino-4-hydroxy-6-hydroxymethyldihydropteridine diphosphokinase
VEYREWAPQYARIQGQFGYDFAREEVAAQRLTELLGGRPRIPPLEPVTSRLAERDVIVVGLAPRAGAPPVWKLERSPAPTALVVADGAAEPCLAANLVPDVVVTDLDGPVPSEVAANARGALVVVHAHGDNLAALERWVPEFPGDVVGSWAGPPTPRLLDVGGFTDGDRAVFLADHVGARRILLWGFDFTTVEETDPAARATKVAKLQRARELLGWLSGRRRAPLLEWRPDGTFRDYGSAGIGPSTQ